MVLTSETSATSGSPPSEVTLHQWIMRCARLSLVKLFECQIDTRDEDEPGVSFGNINITLRTRGKIRGSWSGRGGTLSLQIEDAVRRASLDRRFSGPLVRSDLDNVDIEVWIQTSAEDIPHQTRSHEDILTLGKHGVEIRLGDRHAYYKPSVAITSMFSSPQALLSGVCKKAGLDRNAWQHSDCEVRRTTWKHLVEQSDGAVATFNFLRADREKPLTKAEIASWAERAADYLVASQEADGGFCYRYDPLGGTTNREPANTVRASGCAMAMASFCSSSHVRTTEQHIDATERALHQIIRRAITFGDGLVIPELKSNGLEGAKLGTSALLAAALLTPAFLGKNVLVVTQLLNTLGRAWKDGGLFVCTFSDGEMEDVLSGIDYFPGQALLALTMANEAGLMKCDFQKSFLAYRQHFRAKPSTAFVGWHADVWSRLAVITDSEDYADFVYEQVDWLLQKQVTDVQAGIYCGGFTPYGKPPAYSSIVYTEAVIRAAQLAKRRQDEVRWKEYKDKALLGLGFCSRLRLMPEQSFLFEAPNRTVGAFCKSITEFEVRSDFVQHGITMALAALEADILRA